MEPPSAHYGRVARTLHWVMAVLVIGTLIIAEVRGDLPRGSSARGLAGNAHYQIGIAIFILVWIRLAWRLRSTEPAIFPPPPAWQRGVAHAVAWLFYALMIVLPILGLLAQQSEGHAVSFLGGTVPTFIAQDRATSRQLETLHVWLGNVMIGLVAVHVAAVLYHVLILRDDALARMLGTRVALHRRAHTASRSGGPAS